MMPAAALSRSRLLIVPEPTMVLSKLTSSLVPTWPVMVPASASLPVPSSLSEATSTSSFEVASMTMPRLPVPVLLISLSWTSSSPPPVASSSPALARDRVVVRARGNVHQQLRGRVDDDAQAAGAGVVDLAVLDVELAAAGRLQQPGVVDRLTGRQDQHPGGIDDAGRGVVEVEVADRPRADDGVVEIDELVGARMAGVDASQRQLAGAG